MLTLQSPGPQSAWISASPDQSYFTSGWNRATPFKCAYLSEDINLTSWGAQVTKEMERNGDLICSGFIHTHWDKVTYDASFLQTAGQPINNQKFISGINSAQYCNGRGHAAFKKITQKIGGVDYSKFTDITLHIENVTRYGVDKNTDEMLGYNSNQAVLADEALNESHTYTNLPFWWSQPGKALPIVSMLGHDSKLYIETRKVDELVTYLGEASTSNSTFPSKPVAMNLILKYGYLSKSERNILCGNPLIYLIEAWDITDGKEKGSTTTSITVDAQLNHPSKGFYLFSRQNQFVASGVNDYFNFEGPLDATTGNLKEPISWITLKYNNLDRHSRLPGSFWRLAAANDHCQPVVSKNKIYTIPTSLYAVDAHNPQFPNDPSEADNLSTIDHQRFVIEFPTEAATSTVYIAHNYYNIQRVAVHMSARKYLMFLFSFTNFSFSYLRLLNVKKKNCNFYSINQSVYSHLNPFHCFCRLQAATIPLPLMVSSLLQFCLCASLADL